MAKVYGLHQLQLREGVTGEDLEKFMREEMYPFRLIEGWDLTLLKGDKGERNGEYLLMLVADSIEIRDRDTAREATDEAMKAFLEKWTELGTMVERVWTDYVPIDE